MESDLGATLDIVVDNILRQALWIQVCPSFAILVVTVEWLAFAASCSCRQHWKEDFFNDAPASVRRIVANGLKNPYGSVAVIGLVGLPLSIYACEHQLISGCFLHLLVAILVVGRLIAFYAEGWVIWKFFREIVRRDLESK